MFDITLSEFVEWLEDQRDQDYPIAQASTAACCPIAVFCRERAGYPGAIVFGSVIRTRNGHEYELPNWAAMLVEQIDKDYGEEEISVRQILAAVDRIIS